MLNHSRIFLFLPLLFVGCIGSLSVKETRSELYFRDMDIIRMRDMQAIAELIQEYRYKTGHYPLVTNSQIPQYVYIVTQEQRQEIPPSLLEHQVVISSKALVRALSDGLQRDIRLPNDPQRVAVYKPNYYLYVTRGKHFSLTISLHNPMSLTKPFAKFYNTLEVSSDPWPPNKVWSPEILGMNEEFVNNAKQPLRALNRVPDQE